ncbi:MAG: hypothetical protein UW79_C0002G0035 [Candidatus Yanofskybacteria bacterium GW2011_GWA2_44_9]|uniref:Uncharacterized protein n=2 Tax=Candidatus Yanofskyibacteriota TaxID=1752733 RepID=A0A0G1KGR6_9BACT|nr:MAG: hypothetical protein UW79_C0002G0035 [Candidatus Yanofskybacteria bacterium GW2011_GWA2_44_9]
MVVEIIMKMVSVLIIAVLLPIILGVFGEELFGSLSSTVTPLLLAVSLVGSVVLISLNFRTTGKPLWYFLGGLFVVVNAVLLFLFFNFYPGF